jgi:hypothetical protein
MSSYVGRNVFFIELHEFRWKIEVKICQMDEKMQFASSLYVVLCVQGKYQKLVIFQQTTKSEKMKIQLISSINLGRINQDAQS